MVTVFAYISVNGWVLSQADSDGGLGESIKIDSQRIKHQVLFRAHS